MDPLVKKSKPMDPLTHPVFGDPSLLSEILVRAESTLEAARCTGVHRSWRAQVKEPGFAARFAERHGPVTLGFMVETGEGDGRLTWLVDTQSSRGDAAAKAHRSRVKRHTLGHTDVLGCRSGYVLVEGAAKYSVWRPIDAAEISTEVAPRVSRMEHTPALHGPNTYGQFVVLRQAIPGGMAFFVQDPSGFPLRTNEGVSFNSDSPVRVHLRVCSDSQWQPFTSPQVHAPLPLLFHAKPYCILCRDTIFMVYVVGVIVSFSFVRSSFSTIRLPDLVAKHTSSETQYAVGEHSVSDLTLVHWNMGIIHTFVLDQGIDEHTWIPVATIDFLYTFRTQFSDAIWDRFFKNPTRQPPSPDVYSLQIRSVSRNGSFVIVTLGGDCAYFVFDVVDMKLTEVMRRMPRGILGNIFPLSEPWPPSF